MILELKDLHVGIEGKEIIKGINLKIKQGETHVIMGPNGSGKSTLAKAIMGHPRTIVTKGDILIDNESALGMTTDKRAKSGLFLQFQNPVEIEGVGFINFLHLAKQSVGNTESTKDFMKEIKSNINDLKMGEDFLGRSLNQGFSGGEKKKAEVLQLSVLRPKIAILDEPDSGLDIDAIKVVSNAINNISEKENLGLLIITHYSRILSFIKPQFVHVMVDGAIVAEGGNELIEKLEKEGYDSYINKK
ncbi:MAG: Fe-S cluster assembly ATPase SufC [Candidatus Micrarchaeaceae archaeon]|jgi:Fe-S cluster assembly ATP-binding protein